MHLLLIVIAVLLFVLFAPIKLTLLTALGVLIVGVAGQRAAQVATGAAVTFGEVFRSIGLAFVFVTVVLALLLGVGATFSGVGVLLLLAGVLFAFVGGFRVGMGIELGPASVVAGVTTGISMILFFAFRPLV